MKLVQENPPDFRKTTHQHSKTLHHWAFRIASGGTRMTSVLQYKHFSISLLPFMQILHCFKAKSVTNIIILK
jgi:hypothetical protein